MLSLPRSTSTGAPISHPDECVCDVPKDITALYICQTALDNSNRVKITSGCLCFF